MLTYKSNVIRFYHAQFNIGTSSIFLEFNESHNIKMIKKRLLNYEQP